MLSTHILPEVEQLCDRVLIIDRGRLVADGTPREPARELGARRPRVTVKEARRRRAEVLAGIPGVSRGRAEGDGRLAARVRRRPTTCAKRSSAPPSRGWVLLELVRETASLEDVFVRLTTGDETRADEALDAAEAGRPATHRGGDVMSGFLAILDRELRAYFFSPLAYVVLAFFLFVNGVVFW